MTRLIDADVLLKELRKSCEYHAENSREFSLLQRDIIIVQEQPTIDAVPLDGSFLKMSRGDYLIYKRHWLYEHFDQEIDIQRSAMKSMGYEYVGKNTDAVRHGKWTVTPVYIKCSECGESFMLIPQNYCPNCGCRMDEND